MTFANRVVGAVLSSPAHRLLSGSTDLVRYCGRRSGATIVTPTQYARSGDDVVILVGRARTKTWWRNFRQDRDVDVLVQGHWLPMTARVVTGTDDPATLQPLLDAYLARFPKAARLLPPEAGDGDGSAAPDARDAVVVVWCRPR